ITHNEFKAQNLTEQHADNISQHTAKIDELNKRVISKQQEINSLLRTRSWIITKPLRFTFRLLRGQHRIALQPLKGQVREQLKHIYYKAPASYRRILLNAAFKVRPGWFQHHPQFLKANSGAFQSNVKKDGMLTDITQQSEHLTAVPEKVAVHCHIFYHDLINEFRQHLTVVPFAFDVFVSVTTDEAAKICERELRKVTNIRKLKVNVVPNRGRDIAPMFVEFGEELKGYDYIAHIQSKKSFYNGGKTVGWREYLLNGLFGSTSNINRIFSLFEKNTQLGIIYPQVFSEVPYMAFTWLANRAKGAELCARIGITMPDGYFDFPAGSMFWARMDAMRPLFDLNLKWEDFPEETGQTDGTTAHAIERLLGVLPTALGYESFIIKDLQTPSWSPLRLDHQYLPRSEQAYSQIYSDDSVKVVAFDIFDTLLVRPLLNPDHTKKIVALQLTGKERESFDNYRVIAENQARSNKGLDVDLREIYVEFAKLSGLSMAQADQIRSLEENVELASVTPRRDVIELIAKAKHAGKRVVLISDMFLMKSTIEAMLANNEVVGWDKLYLSSDRGVRKDNGKLYELMMKEEGVEGREVVMVGDNERSDYQLPMDLFGIKAIHIFRAKDLASSLPAYRTYLTDIIDPTNINDELTLGLLIKHSLNKISAFDGNDVNLFGSDAHKIGFNVVGPVILAFCQWLVTQAKADKVNCLYFLAREGKLIKQVYDSWASSIPDAPKSYYLQVSRRAVNVPIIASFEDVKNIAQSEYYPNTIASFFFERFGLELTEQRWDEVYNKGLWNRGQMLEIHQRDVAHLEPLLQFLLPDILSEAKVENLAMMKYLEACEFISGENIAVVDVGYSGTIQKALNRLVPGAVHGYYFATAENVREGMPSDVLARGCYVNESKSVFVGSRIFTESFNLEKLLSASDPQIIKYTITENGELDRKFKVLREGERSTWSVRDELQLGCMSFVDEAVIIRDGMFSEFEPSLTVADALYTDFTVGDLVKRNPVLEKMILDDDYCGRGLIS
ncbi:HAD hydrolase-like protein, partial [Serratia marcescens]